MVFGYSRFHDYIYGVPNVTVESDHKSLESHPQKTVVPLWLWKITDNTKVLTECSLQP